MHPAIEKALNNLYPKDKNFCILFYTKERGLTMVTLINDNNLKEYLKNEDFDKYDFGEIVKVFSCATLDILIKEVLLTKSEIKAREEKS